MNIDHRYQLDIQKKLQQLRCFTRPRAIEIAEEMMPRAQAELLFDQWLRGGFIRLHEITTPSHHLGLFESEDAKFAECLQTPEAQTYIATFRQGRKQQASEADLVMPLSAMEAILIRAENARNQMIVDSGRNGQSDFRKRLVLLHKRCQVSGCEIEAVLQAAHIEPYANGGSFNEANGLLLRSDYHILFDKLFLGVGPDLRTHVAPCLQGSEYAQHETLRMPAGASEKYRAGIRAQLTQHFQAFCEMNGLSQDQPNVARS